MNRLIATVFALAVTAGCGRSDVRDAARDPALATTLRIGSGGEPKSLDPQIVTGVIEERVLSSLFEGLVNLDFETMQPIPGVAESWDISDDGLVYTFHLRENARWSNGEPVTAEDFVYSWRRILSPPLAAEYAYLLYPIENAEAFNNGTLTDFGQVGVRAIDSRTLEVRLRAPTPYFLSLQIHFSFYPVHRATIEAFDAFAKRDTAWTRPGNHISNGPFALLAWTPNKEIVAERSPNYWGMNDVALERIVYLPVQDPSTEERLFRAGEIDITDELPLAKIAEYRENHADVLVIQPIIATEFVRFNTTRKPFDNVYVRKAFAYAIDRAAIVERVMRGGQTPATSFVPPGLGGYEYGASDRPAAFHMFDPSLARAELAKGGYPDGHGFPEVTLIYDTNDNNRRYCEALQNMWLTNLGVRVQLQNMDGKSWLSAMMSLDYDLARSFWVADYPDPSNFLEMFYSNSGNNRTGFALSAYEMMLRDAATATQPADRHARFQAAENRLLSEAPITPVYFQTRAFLRDSHLQGLTSNNLGRIDYRRLSFTE